MELKKTKIEEINELAKKIAKDKRVKAVYLFGSYANGKTHTNSDIDICVISDESVESIWDLKRTDYNSDVYDLSLFSSLPLNIRFRVLSRGIPLIVKDKTFMYKIKMATSREYLDFKWRLHRMCMEKLKCTM